MADSTGRDGLFRLLWFGGRLLEALLLTGAVMVFVQNRQTEQQQQTEAELKENLAMVKRAKKLTGVGYWTIQLSNQQMTWSTEAKAIFTGGADFDLEMMAAKKLIHPDDTEKIVQTVHKALRNRQAERLEHRVIRPDGREIIVLNHFEVDLDAQGQPYQLFGTVMDVTAQRQAEQQLRQSQEKLQAVDQLKEALFAYTSGQLKAPLNAIIGISEALREIDREFSPEQQEYVAMINSCGRKLAHTINDMADVFQLWKGELRLTPQSLNLAEVVRQVVADAEFLQRNRDVVLECRIPDGLPAVWADENRLAQVIWNLLDNAYKFTQSGRVTVAASHQGDRLQLTVTDTGSGIDAERQEEIRRFFAPLDCGIPHKPGVVGLGLSVAKHLVEMMGGRISLESEAERGTRVSITMPVSRDSNGAGHTDSQDKGFSSEKSPAVMAHKLKYQGDPILLVDNDDRNMLAISSMLLMDGYRVIQARDAKQAMGIIAENSSLRLAIIARNLPTESGEPLSRLIRQKKDAFRLPILQLTSGHRSQDANRELAEGVNDVLSQPVELSELRARVRTLVELQKTFAQAVKAEVKYLQSQIKPHFIHNALNTIISVSRKDSDQARELLIAFSNYLRGCFADLEKPVPIQTEIRLVQSYVAIEQARFGDKLQVSYQIETSNAMIPPLMIQPLVENALAHGLRPKKKGGTIVVASRLDGDKVVIRVSDDGVGIPADKLPTLLQSDGMIRGIGLNNINNRLKQLYGTELKISSQENLGTSIEMTIPCVQPPDVWQ